MVFLKNLKSLVLIKEKRVKNSGNYRKWQRVKVAIFLEDILEFLKNHAVQLELSNH